MAGAPVAICTFKSNRPYSQYETYAIVQGKGVVGNES